MAVVLALTLLALHSAYAAFLPDSSLGSQELPASLEPSEMLDAPATLDTPAMDGRVLDGDEVSDVIASDEPLALLIGKDVKRVLRRNGLPDGKLKGFRRREQHKDLESHLIESHEWSPQDSELSHILDQGSLQDPDDEDLKKAITQLLREVAVRGVKRQKKNRFNSKDGDKKGSGANQKQKRPINEFVPSVEDIRVESHEAGFNNAFDDSEEADFQSGSINLDDTLESNELDLDDFEQEDSDSNFLDDKVTDKVKVVPIKLESLSHRNQGKKHRKNQDKQDSSDHMIVKINQNIHRQGKKEYYNDYDSLVPKTSINRRNFDKDEYENKKNDYNSRDSQIWEGFRENVKENELENDHDNLQDDRNDSSSYDGQVSKELSEDVDEDTLENDSKDHQENQNYYNDSHVVKESNDKNNAENSKINDDQDNKNENVEDSQLPEQSGKDEKMEDDLRNDFQVDERSDQEGDHHNINDVEKQNENDNSIDSNVESHDGRTGLQGAEKQDEINKNQEPDEIKDNEDHHDLKNNQETSYNQNILKQDDKDETQQPKVYETVNDVIDQELTVYPKKTKNENINRQNDVSSKLGHRSNSGAKKHHQFDSLEIRRYRNSQRKPSRSKSPIKSYTLSFFFKK